MSIFILEDNIIQAQNLKQLIKDICRKQNIPYDFIKVTARSQEIIENIPLTTYIPIYFLDVEIKNEEHRGFQIAQQIREYDSNGIIIFVTTHADFAPISYHYMVSALTFIDKGLPFHERYSLFKQCLFHYHSRNIAHIPADDFIVDNENATVRVPFSNVEYIKTGEPHRLLLVTDNRLIQFYGRLKEVETIDDRDRKSVV